MQRLGPALRGLQGATDRGYARRAWERRLGTTSLPQYQCAVRCASGKARPALGRTGLPALGYRPRCQGAAQRAGPTGLQRMLSRECKWSESVSCIPDGTTSTIQTRDFDLDKGLEGIIVSHVHGRRVRIRGATWTWRSASVRAHPTRRCRVCAAAPAVVCAVPRSLAFPLLLHRPSFSYCCADDAVSSCPVHIPRSSDYPASAVPMLTAWAEMEVAVAVEEALTTTPDRLELANPGVVRVADLRGGPGAGGGDSAPPFHRRSDRRGACAWRVRQGSGGRHPLAVSDVGAQR